MEFLQAILAQLGNTKKLYGHHKEGRNMSCIAEECHKVMSEYNCTCVRGLPSHICHENPDPTIPIVLWSISAVILLLLMVELFIIRFKCSILDNFFGKLVFSMGIVSSIVTQLCTMQYLQDNSDNVTVWYNIVLGVVSPIFITFGYSFLFTPRSPDNNIGSHDRGMGLVVGIISILVVILEIVLIIMVYKSKHLSDALDMFLLVFTFEKIVQVVIYLLIRRRNPDPEFRKGAVFYFKFLSYLNFTLWLNRIPFTDIPLYDEVSHTYVLQYVDQTYKALVIDYRLLFALLFLEHALAIDDEDGHEHVINEVDREFQTPEKRHLYTAIGVGIGLIFLALEIINAAQFWNECLPDIVNLFPIVVDIGLVVLGCLLLRNVAVSVLHNKKVNLVLLMVASMGAVSIVYLFHFGFMSLISFKHDKPVSHVRWSACVFLARASSLLVLLLVYTGIPVSTMESGQNHNNKNYRLVSALCCGLFARFIGSILDEFDDTMHEIAHQHLESNKLRSLQDLFAIGPLFQLAATLHLALHFLLMLWRLYERPRIANEEDQGVGHVEPNGGNYGALAAADVDNQPNGPVVQQNGHQQQDCDFESFGIHQLEGDQITNERRSLLQAQEQGQGIGHGDSDDEHTRLLQPEQRC